MTSYLKKYPKILKEIVSKSPLDNLLKYYDISNGKKSKDKKKIFIVAGEHPRELISTDILYNILVQILTNKVNLLENYDFRLIINAVPYSRIEVENGNFCLRGNQNNVDINRNWKFNWVKTSKNSEDNSGIHPFSEKETVFIKEAAEEFKPDMYFTIHSGDYGLYIPFTSSFVYGIILLITEIPNKTKMTNFLFDLKSKFCSICRVGSYSRRVGKKLYGTSLDYVFHNLKVPYVFAFEVYSNLQRLPELTRLIKVQKMKQQKLNQEENESISFFSNNNQFMYNNLSYEVYKNNQCFLRFNPDNKSIYEFVVNNWTEVKNYFYKGYSIYGREFL